MDGGDTDRRNEEENDYSLVYGINDNPPWYLCIVFAMQHCLLSISGLISPPLLLASSLCLFDNDVGNEARSYLISSVMLVTGICTILQSTFGTRLPILQGNSLAMLAASFAILSLPHNQCPLAIFDNNSSVLLYNDTDGTIVDGNELWMRRIRELQGAIMIASLVEVFLGLTGSISFLLKYLGPLTITPTITLLGLDLFKVAPNVSESHWGIAMFTTFTLVICSQYLKNVLVPIPMWSRSKKVHITRISVFKMFPVIIALLAGWFLSWILTITDTISPDPSSPGYLARTDARSTVLSNMPWFRFPYPFQWGLPVVTPAGVIAMLAGVLGSTIESIGDYYACAKVAMVPPPPRNTVNRGIFIEGLSCVLCGIVGTCAGSTSFSSNIAAIGITRVGSRRVLQVAGFIFMCFGIVSKVGSLFVTIPAPVIGGLFIIMFGMLVAIGLSNLQYVDMNSPRNIFIVGFSLYNGLAIPNWIKDHPGAIKTGSDEFDKILSVLLGTAMLCGGIIGLILDNTLPGTAKERGIVAWNNQLFANNEEQENTNNIADQYYSAHMFTYFSNCEWARYIPILPQFEQTKKVLHKTKRKKRKLLKANSEV